MHKDATQFSNADNLVIWSVSMSGNSYFMIDIWNLGEKGLNQNVGLIETVRFIISSCTIEQMNFSTEEKLRVLDFQVIPLPETDSEQRFRLSVTTEFGLISVRGLHVAEHRGTAILS